MPPEVRWDIIIRLNGFDKKAGRVYRKWAASENAIFQDYALEINDSVSGKNWSGRFKPSTTSRVFSIQISLRQNLGLSIDEAASANLSLKIVPLDSKGKSLGAQNKLPEGTWDVSKPIPTSVSISVIPHSESGDSIAYTALRSGAIVIQKEGGFPDLVNEQDEPDRHKNFAKTLSKQAAELMKHPNYQSDPSARETLGTFQWFLAGPEKRKYIQQDIKGYLESMSREEVRGTLSRNKILIPETLTRNKPLALARMDKLLRKSELSRRKLNNLARLRNELAAYSDKGSQRVALNTQHKKGASGASLGAQQAITQHAV